jgi:hypothetical protein
MSTNFSRPGTYENIIIGNFLVGFGLLMGYRHKDEELEISEMCVNLTQQTGFDKAIGDVLLEVAGIIRVLEFKRATNKSIKRKSKGQATHASLKRPGASPIGVKRKHGLVGKPPIESEPTDSAFYGSLVRHTDRWWPLIEQMAIGVSGRSARSLYRKLYPI